MIDDLINYLFLPVAQEIILGIVEAIKKLGIKKKYLPSIVIIGAVCGILVYGILFGYGVLKGIIIGIFLGILANKKICIYYIFFDIIMSDKIKRRVMFW